MAQTLAATTTARSATPLQVQIRETATGERYAHLGTQKCVFEPGAILPGPGTTLAVSLSRPVYARDADGYVDYSRPIGLKVRILDSVPPPASASLALVVDVAPRRPTPTWPELALAA